MSPTNGMRKSQAYKAHRSNMEIQSSKTSKTEKGQLRVAQWEVIRRCKAGLTHRDLPALPRRPFNWHPFHLYGRNHKNPKTIKFPDKPD